MKYIVILFYLTSNLWAIEIEKTFQVEGMMCNNACPKKIIESTYDIDGIKNCTVNFKSKGMRQSAIYADIKTKGIGKVLLCGRE